jgi:hypothetical protein
MGFAFCRFREETGCSETGSREYHAFLSNMNIFLDVPEMWKHYMTRHLVQPTKREKEVVMSADPNYVKRAFWENGPPKDMEKIQILYVEKASGGYTHPIGDKVDTEFAEKLEIILSKVKPNQTKGL